MDKKILKWNFIFQYGWVLTNVLNAIILLPLYLNHIDKDTLGIWLATGSILGWMTLVDPGVGEVLQQKIAELRGKKQTTDIGKTIGSGFIASAIILLVSVCFGWGCYFFVGDIINKNVSQYPYLSEALFITVLATGLSLVSFSITGINQGLHNSAHVAISSLSANFLFLIVNLVFLYAGFGVMSIALANLIRALYINVFNITSLLKLLKLDNLPVVFEKAHFRKFIGIFSFTSLSKIITGFSYSIEMIVLARYIPPGLITVLEINRRPIGIAYALIGRHSVALMPLISHAKGSGDRLPIIQLVSKQFKLYSYAALFACFLFLFNYEYMITAWTGKGQYAGDFLICLMIGGLFVGLISYFMATIGYALGDIKINSVYNIIRNIMYGVLMFFAAKNYGIAGALMLSLVVTLVADVFFYTYRVYKLGYLPANLVKRSLLQWMLIIPLSLLAGWGCTYITEHFFSEALSFSKLLINSAMFSGLFMAMSLLSDREVRDVAKKITNRFFLKPIYKLIRA